MDPHGRFPAVQHNREDPNESSAVKTPTRRRPYATVPSSLSVLCSLLLLQVLVGAEGDQTTDEDESIQTDAKAGAGSVGGRGNGARDGSLGLGITRLQAKRHCQQIQVSRGARADDGERPGGLLTLRFSFPTRS